MQKTVAFVKEMEAEGRNVLVFENPHKHAANAGFKDAYEENRSAVNTALRNNGVRILDIDDYLDEHAIDRKTIFFKTDHHWLPQSGLWANGLLCDYLNEHFGYHIDTDIFDLSHYEVETLKNQFLGSFGKKVTEVYTKKDDFDILTPTYAQDITVFNSAYCKTTTETRRGTIPETLYDYEILKMDDDVRSDYSLYGYGDQPLIMAHNNNRHDGSSLLLIKRSFADTQIPTLTQAVEDFYAIDLRYFGGSLRTFIQKKNPQTIIIGYSTDSFSRDSLGEIFPSGRNTLFDFN